MSTSNEYVVKEYEAWNCYANATPVVLAADIGGTNSNFGFFTLGDSACSLLFSVHAKSQAISEFAQVVADVLAYAKQRFDVTVSCAVFGAAGVVNTTGTRAKPTNLTFVIDAHTIRAATGLQQVDIINDFQAVGYGIDMIHPHDLIPINKGTPVIHGARVVLGAGTGMGKSILIWDKDKKLYEPMPSEGGHGDFAAQAKKDLALVQYTQKEINATCAISWEDILSGYGIQRIYQFLGEYNGYEPTTFDREIAAAGFQPDNISRYRTESPQAKDTFDWYSCLYARCAKNFALDALALGGVYIAGGIAAKNIPVFRQACFLREFVNCGKLAHLLEDMPVYIVSDYNVSMYGAAAYLLLHREKK